MKKYGEVIGTEKRKSVIRIYKEKNGELSPTSLTVIASDAIASTVGDMVEVEIDTFLFLLSTIFGYLLPFLTMGLVFLVISPITDNILAIEAVLLSVLLLTFVSTRYITSLHFFRRIYVCAVTEKIEIEQ